MSEKSGEGIFDSHCSFVLACGNIKVGSRNVRRTCCMIQSAPSLCSQHVYVGVCGQYGEQ